MTATYEKLMGLKSVDPNGMIDLVSATPDQFEEGWQRAAGVVAGLRATNASHVVVVGMGGSAIAGDLVRSCFGPELERYVHVCRGGDIPKAISRNAFYVFSSYSGGTAETLGIYDAVRHAGMQAVAVTSGGALEDRCKRDGIRVCELPPGLPPRAALGYSFPIVLRIASAVGAGPMNEADCDETVQLLRDLSGRLTSTGADNTAAALAGELHGKYPVIYACNGLLASVARRWGTQLNENSKSLGHVAVFPELVHNEICGWDGKTGVEGIAHIVSLEDVEDSDAAKRRRDIMFEGIENVVGDVTRVHSEGHSRMARLMTAVMLGDFTSVYLAYLYGIDPTPVERISALKTRLAGR